MGEEPCIASFGYFRPSVVFYTDHRIREIESREEAQAFIHAAAPGTFLLTTDEELARWDKGLDPGVAVLAELPKFLRPGKALLVGRPSSDEATARKPAADDESEVR